MALVIVHAGNAKHDGRSVTPLGVDQPFSVDFGLRIRPSRIQRPVLVDALARFAWCVYEHRAGEHELLDVKTPQASQQTFGPSDRDLFILRTRLTREIVVRGEVDDGRDAPAGHLADTLQAALHAVVRREIDGHTLCSRWWARRSFAIEPCN